MDKIIWFLIRLRAFLSCTLSYVKAQVLYGILQYFSKHPRLQLILLFHYFSYLFHLDNRVK